MANRFSNVKYKDTFSLKERRSVYPTISGNELLNTVIQEIHSASRDCDIQRLRDVEHW